MDLQRTWISNRSFLGDPIYALGLCHKPGNRRVAWRLVLAPFPFKTPPLSKSRDCSHLRSQRTAPTRNAPVDRNPPALTTLCQVCPCHTRQIALYCHPSEVSSITSPHHVVSCVLWQILYYRWKGIQACEFPVCKCGNSWFTL